MKIIFFMLILGIFIIIPAIGEDTSPPYFYITEFSQGKAREVFGSWIIYKNTEKLVYETNGTCGFSSGHKPCMWYGEIFEYETNLDSVTLICVNKRSNMELPYTYELKLDSNNGLHVEMRFTLNTPNRNEIISETACTFNGKEVLNYRYVYIN